MPIRSPRTAILVALIFVFSASGCHRAESTASTARSPQEDAAASLKRLLGHWKLLECEYDGKSVSSSIDRLAIVPQLLTVDTVAVGVNPISSSTITPLTPFDEITNGLQLIGSCLCSLTVGPYNDDKGAFIATVTEGQKASFIEGFKGKQFIGKFEVVADRLTVCVRMDQTHDKGTLPGPFLAFDDLRSIPEIEAKYGDGLCIYIFKKYKDYTPPGSAGNK